MRILTPSKTIESAERKTLIDISDELNRNLISDIYISSATMEFDSKPN